MSAPDGEPEQMLAGYAEALLDVVDEVIEPWVQRCVTQRWQDYTGVEADAALRRAAAEAGAVARRETMPVLRSLLAADAEAQWTAPLAVLRRAVVYPTEVLRGAGVPAVVRDDFAERNFPDDVYGLSPASFADIDERLHEPGLVWGAAKAHVVLRRRRGGTQP